MWVKPSDEPLILREELEKARARLRSLERAPLEGRITNFGRYERRLHFARLDVRDLEREQRAVDLLATFPGREARDER